MDETREEGNDGHSELFSEEIFRDNGYESVLNTIRALSNDVGQRVVSPEAAIGLRVYQGLMHTYYLRRIRRELESLYAETISSLQIRFDDVAIMLGDEFHQYNEDEFNILMQALEESFEDATEEENGDDQNSQQAIDLLAPAPKIATAKLENQCAVCFEDISRLQTYRKLECSHAFHTRCIDQWFARKLSCPMCRTSLV